MWSLDASTTEQMKIGKIILLLAKWIFYKKNNNTVVLRHPLDTPNHRPKYDVGVYFSVDWINGLHTYWSVKGTRLTARFHHS